MFLLFEFCMKYSTRPDKLTTICLDTLYSKSNSSSYEQTNAVLISNVYVQVRVKPKPHTTHMDLTKNIVNTCRQIVVRLHRHNTNTLNDVYKLKLYTKMPKTHICSVGTNMFVFCSKISVGVQTYRFNTRSKEAIKNMFIVYTCIFFFGVDY